MTLYFSPSTLGFYDSAIGGEGYVPEDAVEVTAEQRRAALEGEGSGQRIAAGEDGTPVLVSPPAPSTAEQWAARRRQARAELSSTADSVLALIEEGESVPTAMRDYRAALRAIANAETGDPSLPFPEAP